MDRAGRKAAALLQSSGRTACGCAADNVRIRERLLVDIQKNTLNGCLASTRAAGNNTDWGWEGGLNRLPLFRCQNKPQFLLLLINLVIQVPNIGQAAPLEHLSNALGGAILGFDHDGPVNVALIQSQPIRLQHLKSLVGNSYAVQTRRAQQFHRLPDKVLFVQAQMSLLLSNFQCMEQSSSDTLRGCPGNTLTFRQPVCHLK